jgi:plasmid stabilization system protein ParE
MPRVILSERAQSDLGRLYAFLAGVDERVADNSIETIISSFEQLEQMPLIAPYVDGRNDIRKFIIPFGQSGYLAFYEYIEVTDTVVIATIMHQREKYFFESVGKN